MTVRTRFAPSPTGYLHIGSVRTALYAWLYAKKMGGQCILRIEDTDRERSTDASIDAILQGMAWLGLACDEGPFYQMDRLDRYRAVIDEWLDNGKAYRCACSKERLEHMRLDQMARKEKPRYDGHCRDLHLQPSDFTQDNPGVIRFRHQDFGETVFQDHVHGSLVFANHELDDLVLVRSDGIPTYNFAVVVDDADMRITHVIRGDDHINNTPRQIQLLEALGAAIPEYAHLPMILGPDGKRLSKRHGAVSVLQYRNEGFLPQALLNYLLRLGWSHGDQEIFSPDEMIALFNLDHLSKSAASFNPEKLLWVNQQYIKTLPSADIAAPLKMHLQSQGIRDTSEPALESIVDLLRDRAKTLVEMADKSFYFYQDPENYEPKSAAQFLTAETLPVLQYCFQQFSALDNWQCEALHTLIAAITAYLQLKMPQIAQPLRVALTGSTNSPSIDATLFWIGKSRVLVRLTRAIQYIESVQ